MGIKNMAVFCGSKMGNNPLYAQHAKEVGEWLGQNNIGLIYGGGKVGIMGVVADAALSQSCNVIGIIPEILLAWEQQHYGISDLRVVTDMHVRKKMMYELCDAAIVLAGGYGTLDELFEIITWNNLKIHEKKIILLNSAGFYDHLIAHIDKMQEEGYLYGDWKERILVFDEPSAIFSFLSQDKN
jgi:uncharacterized protein (TIGR00730 family)